MQTRPYAMPALLHQIRTHRFRIPQFQRDFRWTNSQVKLLVDSIARNYPMGSLLVLAKNPEVPLQSRNIEATMQDAREADLFALAADDTVEDEGSLFYVLDGQQRLTSIARVFLNGDPGRCFYFDLKEMVDSFSADDTTWIKARNRRRRDTDRRDNNRLMRADIAMDRERSDIYVTEYIEDSGEFDGQGFTRKQQREIAAQIKGVFETIRNYQVPIVVLDHDAALESVCRVFETINSTGTRLTTFDLAVAKFYPKPDLRALWQDALDSHPVLAEFEVDGERALQVLVLRLAEETQRALEVNRGTQLKLDPEYIENHWEGAVQALAHAFDWAKHMGARPKTLPNHALLVAIGSHWCARPMLEPNHLLLKRWFYSHLLQPGASQAANYRIGRYFRALRLIAAEKSLDIPQVYLTSESLQQLVRASDSRFKALQCVLAGAVTEDLVTGRRIDAGEIEDHHIFPRAECKRKGLNMTRCESIVNRLAISKDSNRAISDRPPTEYLTELMVRAENEGTLEGLRSRLEDCFIPNSSLSPEEFTKQLEPSRFDSFIEKRAALLLGELRRVIGDSLASVIPEEYEED